MRAYCPGGCHRTHDTDGPLPDNWTTITVECAGAPWPAMHVYMCDVCSIAVTVQQQAFGLSARPAWEPPDGHVKAPTWSTPQGE